MEYQRKHFTVSFLIVSFEKTSWPRAFICFLVFGTRDETLSLVFYILHENFYSLLVHVDSVG